MKKYILIFMFFEVMMNYSFAQNQVDTNSIELLVPDDPYFPGGNMAFGEFIAKNLHYPKISLNRYAQGKVIISCSVLVDGTLTDFKISKSSYFPKEGDSEEVKLAYESLDNEALRLIKLSPKWVPAKLHGKPVKIKELNIPINFTLE